MKSLRTRAIGLFLGLAISCTPVRAQDGAGMLDNRCRVGTQPTIGARYLVNTAEALRTGKAFVVVALGSSSTQGFGSTSPEKSYPAQLAAILQKRFPGKTITVINKGVGGDTIDKMLARLPNDVLALKPNLVIWQTGTNDAIRGVNPERFRTLLDLGVRQIKSRGIDLILMTPQYAPKLTGAPHYDAYRDLMHVVAARRGVTVFRRFNLSKSWSEISKVPMTTNDGLHPTDAAYRCTALLLADHIAKQSDAAMTDDPTDNR